MKKPVKDNTKKQLSTSYYRMVVDCSAIVLQDPNWRNDTTVRELADVLKEVLKVNIDPIYLYRSLRSNPSTFALRKKGTTFEVRLK